MCTKFIVCHMLLIWATMELAGESGVQLSAAGESGVQLSAAGEGSLWRSSSSCK